MKTKKIIYWISTGLISAFLVMSAGMYIFGHDDVSLSFEHLGFPTYIIYPLAVAKILGVFAIVSGLSKTLKEWAYSGIFFNVLLAFFAHVMAKDGEFAPALVAMTLLFTSYFSGLSLKKNESKH